MKRSNDLKAAGVAPVIIAFFNLDLLKNWIKDTNCTFPVYLDSNMSTYQAFGLPRSMKALRIPTMRWFGERMANGTMNQHKSGTNVQEDVIQLGGDFTVECSSRKMIFLYPSKSASDRPSLEQIFQV